MFSDSDIKEIISIITKNGKGIRKSKPKVDKKRPNTGRAAYVWRNVMFTISSVPAHQCIPVCADFDLADADWENRRTVCKELDKIVDTIVHSVPKSQWHGTKRWAKAFGVI